MQIGILAQDGCFASAVASMIDIIRTAEFVRPQIDPSIAPIAVEVAAARPGRETSARLPGAIFKVHDSEAKHTAGDIPPAGSRSALSG